ncbi:MAG: creatininase family protein [Candidatus Zixiibacteriota bacterium]|jgi:creatinine amidohydrolase
MPEGNAPALKLAEICWKDFRKLVPDKYDGIALAIGTIEAHGGIPLGTDIIIPESLCEPVARRFGLVVAPTVNYGVTRTLLPYPGSHTVTSETFQKYVTEIFIGFGRMGFRRLVVLNGHGGHLDELKGAAQDAYREADIFTVVLHWWLMAPEASVEVYGAEGGHAAAEETAGVLAVRPDLVRPENVEGLKAASYDQGVYRFPFPRPVGVRKAGTGGMPSLDEAKAKEYMALIERRCIEAVDEAFTGWREELGR